jgi:hypothetical protein
VAATVEQEIGEGAGRDARLRAGVRAGAPFAVAGGLLALSFGVVAQDNGLSALAAIAMSAIVFAGSAQFAAIAIIGQGGTVAAAIGAAALMNSRFLPMGVALGSRRCPAAPRPRRAGPGGRRLVVGAGVQRRRDLRPLAAVRLDGDPVRRLGRRHDRRCAGRRRARRPARARASTRCTRRSSWRC